MDYKTIYQKLTDKVRLGYRSKKDGMYYEAHHIKPRCFGGEGDGRNTKHPNIVLLTPKEHYIAHLLLTVIYPDSPAIWKAFWNMCQTGKKERYRPSAKKYQIIRNSYIVSIQGPGNHFYGKRHKQESLIKIGGASKGRKPNLGNKYSKETRARLSYIAKQRKLSEDTKKKIGKAIGGGNHYKAIPIVCTKTGKIFGSGKELSEFTNIPFSTVRRWLNGTTMPPENFHYKRQNLAYDQ